MREETIGDCRKLRVLDLFSGIGGFSLGLERTGGFETVAFCEIEPYPRAVLAKHWPGVPIYEDVRTLTADTLSRDGIAVDVICGGFPCQDISVAGARVGIEGSRSGLWREYARIIREVRPRHVIVENSPALLYLGLHVVLGDLAALGFDAEWHCLRASAVGAPFEGDRIYILATANEVDGEAGMGVRQAITTGQVLIAGAEHRASVWMEATGRSARMGHGFSDRVDRRQRTECLGNAVVPQIPEMIGRAILEAT